MGKLHELLAVEPDLKKAAGKTVKDAIKTFSQEQRFVGHAKTYRPLVEDGQPFPDDVQPIVTTVDIELELVQDAFGDWLDAALQKEATNAVASETVMIGAKEFTLPATGWLNLEDKLKILGDIIADIPTNDPAVVWVWDSDNNHWRSQPTTTYRTEKVVEAVVGYPATDEHPAQIKWVPKDVRVGEWHKAIYSGMISVSQKREMLRRTQALLMNFRKARQRANQAEIKNVKMAEAIFSEIFD